MEVPCAFLLRVFCLWLIIGQVMPQDIQPEFPEDFPKTTTEAQLEPSTTTPDQISSTTSEAATEVASTTTEAATELSTTTQVATTTTKAATIPSTTTTFKTPVPTQNPVSPPLPTPPPSFWPTYPPATRPTPSPGGWPTYPPATRPTPPTADWPTYPPATSPPSYQPPYHWNWDPYRDNEQPRCYLREQVAPVKYRWRCGYSGLMPIISCYRCCYYGNSRFAGCRELHSGPCASYSYSWQL